MCKIMIAKKVRQRISTIQQSYEGHMQEMLDELDLLEEMASKQLPIKPINIVYSSANSTNKMVIYAECGNCEDELTGYENYCMNCGREINWESE